MANDTVPTPTDAPVTREEFEALKLQVEAQKRRYIRPPSAL